ILASRADLTSRKILTISRGPTFTPLADEPEYFKTEMHGWNRGLHRYAPAGINPPGCSQLCRTIESNPTSYRVSWEDRSPFIHTTKDGLGLLGTKGFRSARCNAPVREGKWYLEVKIVRGGGDRGPRDLGSEGSHVRLGWGRREAPLNGPVGLDGYSYGYRDKTGDKVTLSRPRPYGRPFASGDVIGMYISLPPRRQADIKDPADPARIKRERIPIDLRGQEVFEILEYPQNKEMEALMQFIKKSSNTTSVPSSATKKSALSKPERPAPVVRQTGPTLRPLPTLPDSCIAFFVNGECQGIAYENLYDYLQLRVHDTSRKVKEKKRTREGVKEHVNNPFDDGSLGYYPFISLFNSACVRINPGPDFDCPPPLDIDSVLRGNNRMEVEEDEKPNWRPICERYPEYMQEQWALDALEEEEGKVEGAKMAEVHKVEAEKKAQRQKKRQEAEARKAAKKAHLLAAEDDRFHIASISQPSPLRQSTVTPYLMDEGPEYSPTPNGLELVSEQNSEYGGETDPAGPYTRQSSPIPPDNFMHVDSVDSLIADTV
ncbi:hypothetical protein CPB85DRAFT_1210317, partial [Mucidula mucida]